MTEPTTDETSLRLQLISTRAENLALRTRVAALEHRNKQLRNRLRRYENSNTPPGKEGGTGEPPDDDDPTDQGKHGTGDDDSTDYDPPSDDTEQEQNDDAGGDSDAASDSEDTSPGRDPGHEGTTRPPPDPDQTVWVDGIRLAQKDFDTLWYLASDRVVDQCR
jgi:hypothetical protein